MKRNLKKGIIVLTILGCIGSTTVMASEKNKVAVDKKNKCEQYIDEKSGIIAKTVDKIISSNNNIESHLKEEEIVVDPKDDESKTQWNGIATYNVSEMSARKRTVVESGSDRSGTAKITLKIWYELSEYRQQEYGRISKVIGKVSGCNGGIRLDSGVTLVKCSYTVGQDGFTKKDGYKEFSKSGSGKTILGKSFQYEPPKSWKAVLTEHSCNMGANQTIVLKRGKSSWSYTLDCKY